MANTYINENEGRGVKLAEACSAGQLVAIHTDGLGYLANAELGGDLQVPAFGFAETAVAAGLMVELKRNGTLNYGAGGLTIGAQVYLAEGTDGGITQTPPSTSGDYVQCVGVATAADEVAIEMDAAYIVA